MPVSALRDNLKVSVESSVARLPQANPCCGKVAYIFQFLKTIQGLALSLINPIFEIPLRDCVESQSRKRVCGGSFSPFLAKITSQPPLSSFSTPDLSSVFWGLSKHWAPPIYRRVFKSLPRIQQAFGNNKKALNGSQILDVQFLQLHFCFCKHCADKSTFNEVRSEPTKHCLLEYKFQKTEENNFFLLLAKNESVPPPPAFSLHGLRWPISILQSCKIKKGLSLYSTMWRS